MFRLKLTLTFLVVIGTMVGLGMMAVSAEKGRIEERLEERVRASHKVYEEMHELRQLRMLSFARDIASSRVKAYVTTLDEFREDLAAVEAEVLRTVPGDPSDEIKAKRQKYVESAPEGSAAHKLMTSFPDRLAAYLESLEGPRAWEAQSKADFVADTRKELAGCAAGFAATLCPYRFAYNPLSEIVEKMRQSNDYGVRPDLVVLTDDRGIGLAHADDPKWSYKTGFGKRYGALQSVREGRAMRDIVEFGDDAIKASGVYFVISYPLMQQGRFRGLLLVGVQIDKALIDRESEVLGFPVTYIDGGKIFRSNLPDTLHTPVQGNAPRVAEDTELTTTRAGGLLIEYVPLTGNANNRDVHVAISGDPAPLTAPLSGLTTWAVLIGVGLFFFGLGFFIWAYAGHFKPYAEIDSGIHEIIGGNQDFEFPYDYSERMWSSMAQSLNLMVGILLGRDHPEDEMSWGALFEEQSRPMPASSQPEAAAGDAEAPEVASAPSKPQPALTVDHSGGLSAEERAKLANEAADAYYRRLHNEFNDARASTGGKTVSYVKFVDKVVRQERRLRAEWECKGVRFHVRVADGQPSLIPVMLDE